MNIAGGTVYLVGAGPGDPGLITVAGLTLVRHADVIVHDRLVASELVGEARSGAEIIDAGKAVGRHRYSQSWINALIVDRASKGLGVVRLKGGDPFLLGRGFEELTACREAGVPCVVVPGVSSALAAPAAVGVPLSHRGAARSIAIITGQVGLGQPGPSLNFAALAAMDTVVILMGRANLPDLAQSLIDAGRNPTTPAACIERATTPKQRMAVGTLATIADRADAEGLLAPVVTVIGEVAASATTTGCRELWPLLRPVVRVPRAV